MPTCQRTLERYERLPRDAISLLRFIGDLDVLGTKQVGESLADSGECRLHRAKRGTFLIQDLCQLTAAAPNALRQKAIPSAGTAMATMRGPDVPTVTAPTAISAICRAGGSAVMSCRLAVSTAT
jgi:hypothetical protein